MFSVDLFVPVGPACSSGLISTNVLGGILFPSSQQFRFAGCQMLTTGFISPSYHQPILQMKKTTSNRLERLAREVTQNHAIFLDTKFSLPGIYCKVKSQRRILKFVLGSLHSSHFKDKVMQTMSSLRLAK